MLNGNNVQIPVDKYIVSQIIQGDDPQTPVLLLNNDGDIIGRLGYEDNQVNFRPRHCYPIELPEKYRGFGIYNGVEQKFAPTGFALTYGYADNSRGYCLPLTQQVYENIVKHIGKDSISNFDLYRGICAVAIKSEARLAETKNAITSTNLLNNNNTTDTQDDSGPENSDNNIVVTQFVMNDDGKTLELRNSNNQLVARLKMNNGQIFFKKVSDHLVKELPEITNGMRVLMLDKTFSPTGKAIVIGNGVSKQHFVIPLSDDLYKRIHANEEKLCKGKIERTNSDAYRSMCAIAVQDLAKLEKDSNVNNRGRINLLNNRQQKENEQTTTPIRKQPTNKIKIREDLKQCIISQYKSDPDSDGQSFEDYYNARFKEAQDFFNDPQKKSINAYVSLAVWFNEYKAHPTLRKEMMKKYLQKEKEIDTHLQRALIINEYNHTYCFPVDKSIKDQRILNFVNAVLNPNCSIHTDDTVEKLIDDAVENIKKEILQKQEAKDNQNTNQEQTNENKKQKIIKMQIKNEQKGEKEMPVSEKEKASMLEEIKSAGSGTYIYSTDILSTDELLKLGFAVLGETSGMLLLLMQT